MAARTRSILRTRWQPPEPEAPILVHRPAYGRVITQCPTTSMQVLTQRHEVLWPDGTAVALHPLEWPADHQPAPSLLTQRAVHHLGMWLVFDLVDIAFALARELHTAAPRSHPGLLMWGLREQYPTAQRFLTAAREASSSAWLGPGRGQVISAAETGTDDTSTPTPHEESMA